MTKQNPPNDESFMRRAMELAAFGLGQVSPNPMVGCVVVNDNLIIGEGWHKKYGESHAEVNAIHRVEDKSLLSQSTVYVNLEPCSHFGKTPPCADMLIAHHVKKVVIANLDSNPLVAGEGVRRLQAAGICVVTGQCEAEGRELNKRFFTYMEKNRPYIILKWAETADGFIAKENYDSKWISNDFSRQLVHKWRAEEDAVLVGSGTVIHDNPQLNVRQWTGKEPVRIVLDRSLTLKDTFQVFDRKQNTLHYNLIKEEEYFNLSRIMVEEKDFLNSLLKDLFDKKIQSVLVEGGAGVLGSFIASGLWDEARVFQSPKTFEKGISAPEFSGTLTHQYDIHSDKLRIYRP